VFQPDGDTKIGKERNLQLVSIFNAIPLDAPIFSVTSYGVLNGNDITTLRYLMNNIILQNKEGLMLMDLNEPYIHGRSNTLIKVKRIQEFIGTVIDVEYADKGTKIEGGISALICEVQECTVPIRVGSGLNNDERQQFAKDPPIGQIIELEAFGKTQSKKGTVSLSMPIYKRMLFSYNHTKDARGE
jgi:hypothetical protein